MSKSIYFITILVIISCSKERKSNRAGKKMQDFVIELSEYSKGIDPSFLIIPQNGEELMYQFLEASEGFDNGFMKAIDAFSVENVFYNGSFSTNNYRLSLLLQAKTKIPIFVSDYTKTQSDFDSSIIFNSDAGFISFPRVSSNLKYTEIPSFIFNEYSNDIEKIKDVKNYLIIINSDNFISKQSFLDSLQSTNFDLIILNAFYKNEAFKPSEIESLKTKANGGKRLVLSSVSIGTAENNRYYWQNDWKLNSPKWLNKEKNENEVWVKFWKKEWKTIIYGNDNSYLKKIINSGFDGAYLVNIESFHFLYFDD
jgi:cysteinyl-tRNA synthetase, unknown class